MSPDLVGSEPTNPNPPQSLEDYVADLLQEIGVDPYISGGRWRFEFTDEQLLALVTKVATRRERTEP